MSSLPAMGSPPAMSAYESDETKPTSGDEQNPFNEENEAHLQSRTIAQSMYTNGGDALQERTECTLKMNSTIESHLRRRVIAQREVHNC
jgi:hypothetical protein